MSVIVNMAMFPLDKNESVSPYVARVLKVIRASGLPHELNSMATCIEGEWDEVVSVVSQCYRELEKDCTRVYLTLTADCRRGAASRMRSKIESLEAKL